MAATIDAKMSVSGVAEFKRNMRDAESSVKALDSALKLNEKQFKQNGDAELYMQNKSALLKKQLEAQSKVVKESYNALQAMKSKGVDEASKSFQDMQRKVYEAQAELINMQTALKEVETGASGAAGGADKLTASINGISKKISLDQVVNGINTISTSLENAAKKAVSLGETIFDAVMDKAKWADDTAQMALMYGIDLETYLQMQKLVQNGLDTTVDAILGAQDKLKRGVGNGGDSIMQTLRELGLLQTMAGKYEDIEFIPEDADELFWNAGKAIMALTDEYEKEAKAQELFGKSWKELVPLFTEFGSREEYQKALKNTNTLTEDEVNQLAELNDRMGELEGNFDTLAGKVMVTLAPALESAAETLSGLLASVLEYLETPEGQAMLEGMAESITSLFEGLETITPEDVVSKVADVFKTVTEGLGWLKDNKDAVFTALRAIADGFLLIKGATLALNIAQVLNGLGGLLGGNKTPTTPTVSAGGDVMKIGAWDMIKTGAKSIAEKVASIGIVQAAANYMTGAISALATADPTGMTALVPQLLADQTVVGRDIRNGMGIGEAFSKVPNTIANSFNEAIENWKNWGQQMYESVLEFEKTYLPDAGTPIGPGKLSEEEQQKQMELWEKVLNATDATVVVKPEVPEDAAEDISDAIGTVAIPITFTYGGGGSGGGTPLYELGLGLGNLSKMGYHANGLFSVPWDGYPAILHKGERVVPAREVAASRNYSSNLYVESMYMNNGQDADALAAKMAAAQRQEQNGYGN